MSAISDVNLLDPDLFPSAGGPPHNLFDAWRSSDPVHWNPVLESYRAPVPGSLMKKGFWVLTRYQDVYDVSRDAETFTSHDEAFLIWDFEGEQLARQQVNFMGMKPADHRAVKHVLVPPFSPKAMKDMEPIVEQLAKEIVDGIANGSGCEFVFEVASKLPVYTFCELMGIPDGLRERVVELGNAVADVESRGQRDDDPMQELFTIASSLAEEKRQNPDDSLMSLLVHSDMLALEPMNIGQFFVVFAVAGHETTRSTAAYFIYLMNRHPEQYQLLLGDVDKHLGNAIEEVLRYASPTTNFRRTATVDTEIGGQPVKAGDKIYLSYPAANRDPDVFENPHVFDITRANACKHLAFGTGPHVCLGARLARMELHALLKEIVTRVPDIRIVGDVKRLRSIWFDAITNLTVTFTAEASRSQTKPAHARQCICH